MYKTKILIVDDEEPARMRLATLIEDIQGQCECEVVGFAQDGQSALDCLVELQPDILLLDVQMPGMTGIELAQHIAAARLNAPPAIVFVTAYDEFALQAFEVHALDYLLKPIRAGRLLDALQRVQHWRAQASEAARQQSLDDTLGAMPRSRQHFSVLEKNRVLLIPVADVLFLKAELKYVTIQTRNRAYLTEESLVSIEGELSETFIRVHRNALVARKMVQGVERAVISVDSETDQEKASESWQVIVRDSTERLPISRRQWPMIKKMVK